MENANTGNDSKGYRLFEINLQGNMLGRRGGRLEYLSISPDAANNRQLVHHDYEDGYCQLYDHCIDKCNCYSVTAGAVASKVTANHYSIRNGT